ncbi:MAG: alpha/beta fold hydrolase [Comamonadaceae bacterium]|nr:alpha/beta fold hydrolase [Comamonadaceae bacterium]
MMLNNPLLDEQSAEFSALVQEMVEETAVTPKELVFAQGTMRLYHYLPQTEDVYRVPLLLVMSMVSKPYIFDLSAGQSFIEYLVRQGFDIYLVDWGVARSEHKGFGVSDYLDGISACMDEVKRHSGEAELTLLGYCLGGVLTALHAALDKTHAIKNLLQIATPIHGPGMSLQHKLLTSQGLDPDLLVDTFGVVPSHMIEGAFQVLRPLQKSSGQALLLNNLSNREFVKAHLRLVRWGDDALPFPGKAFLELVHDLVVGDKVVKGEFEVHGRKADLSTIKMPILHVLAEHDHVVPFASSHPLVELVSSPDKEEWVIKGGHVSLVAGVGAVTRTWPRMVEWLTPRSL